MSKLWLTPQFSSFFPFSPLCYSLWLVSSFYIPLLWRMIKRMADKIGQFGQSQKQPSQPELANLPYTSMSHLISVAADYHRGSISTQRTLSSEWTQQENNLEAKTFSLPRVSRPKASYRLSDFIIQRTLGTGSFGRVHLGVSFGVIHYALI